MNSISLDLKKCIMRVPQGLRMNWLKQSDLLDQHITKSSDLDDLFKNWGDRKNI